jgi:hypothetical protein
LVLPVEIDKIPHPAKSSGGFRISIRYYAAPLTSFPVAKTPHRPSLIWYHPMKVKTEEKLNDAAWLTDRLSFSTESVLGIEDSSDLDIVSAHQQLKNPCEQVLKGWGLLLKLCI